MKVILATSNKGKIEEMRPLVQELLANVTQIIAMAPQGAEETEATFLGNARIKAEALLTQIKNTNTLHDSDVLILADDSGLAVDALNGRPGVHSARYAGDHVEASENVKKLLLELKDTVENKRSCRYVCALYGIFLHGKANIEAEGSCEGKILRESRGSGGFGYDPVFYSLDLNCRMSEASLEDKNRISHRRRAFERFAETFEERRLAKR